VSGVRRLRCGRGWLRGGGARQGVWPVSGSGSALLLLLAFQTKRLCLAYAVHPIPLPQVQTALAPIAMTQCHMPYHISMRYVICDTRM
jgi:hypothetical protein